MKQVPQPDITSYNGFLIPGGWLAYVPDFSADSKYETALIQALTPDFGGMRFQAEKEARARIDELGSVEFVSRLRDFVKRNADIYAKRWPHHIQANNTLKNFDPGELQKRFIPGSKSKGRFPKAVLVAGLQSMAEKARAA